MRATALPALVALAVAAFGGCAPPEPAAPAPTVTATATATKTIQNEPEPNAGILASTSLDGFRKQLEDAGLTCDDWEETVEDVAGSCNDLILLNVQPDRDGGHAFHQAALYLAWNVLRDQERDDVAILVGTNCFVRIGYEDAKTLQKSVGGIILN